MRNLGDRNGEEGEEAGAAQASAAQESMEKGHVERRVMETSKSNRFSHT